METVETPPKFELQPNEKFACVTISPGLDVSDLDENPQFLGHGCWLSRRPPFALDQPLKSALRRITCDAIKDACFVFIAKILSSDPQNSNSEYEILIKRINFLLWGVTITAGVAKMWPYGCNLLAGDTADMEPWIRNAISLELFHATYGSPESTATLADVRRAILFVQR